MALLKLAEAQERAARLRKEAGLPPGGSRWCTVSFFESPAGARADVECRASGGGFDLYRVVFGRRHFPRDRAEQLAKWLVAHHPRFLAETCDPAAAPPDPPRMVWRGLDDGHVAVVETGDRDEPLEALYWSEKQDLVEEGAGWRRLYGNSALPVFAAFAAWVRGAAAAIVADDTRTIRVGHWNRSNFAIVDEADERGGEP
jgi:hypothetical protein